MTNPKASSRLVEAVAVTAELCGRTFTPNAAAMFVQDLAGYTEPAVLNALARCRREVRGMLTLADVIARIDDGRPTADEAWASVPRDEQTTVVWTSEAAQSWAVCEDLLAAGDPIAARMAFRDAYNRIVAEARDSRRPVEWRVSLGHDKRGRENPIREAVAKGRLRQEQADLYLPAPELPVPSLGEIVSPERLARSLEQAQSSLRALAIELGVKDKPPADTSDPLPGMQP